VALALQCIFVVHSSPCPLQVSPSVLSTLLSYLEYHIVPGRSDKERRQYDQRLVACDTRRLCELTSAADSLDLRPVVELTSKALARLIEGKSPEEIREVRCASFMRLGFGA
jgi:hypothetical protein